MAEKKKSTFIREQDPLKQGLKPELYNVLYLWRMIREQDPLKQGLKQLTREQRDAYETFASKIH